MLCKCISLLISLLIFGIKAFAATFVVTSNADSGPGTLRDALTQAAANGSATTDYINFNFADQTPAGRTIVLLSQLPDLSSNLVIDGTSQLGAVFGQSDAHVKIATPDAYSALSIEYIPMTIFNGTGLDHIEIYGLYLYDYYDIVISYPDLKPRTGIAISGGTNIIIGAAGKGNLIRGFNHYSIDLENADNITIQHNVIGLNDQNSTGNGHDEDDINEITAPINLFKCNHILFGGNADEGNTIFTGAFISFYQQTTNNVLSIKSNNFVVFQDGHTTVWVLGEWYGPLVTISTVFDNNVDINHDGPLQASVDADISNNLLSGTAASFNFQSINGVVNVTNNYFNVARDSITDITYYNMPILYAQPLNMGNCTAQFNIGTNDPAKRNLFNHVNVGVVASGTPNIFMRYNDFKCVIQAAYVNNIFTNNPYTLPKIAISGITTSGTNTNITGTASPNGIVDIYSSESCQSECSIRSYIKTVIADNAGNWQTSIVNLNGIFYCSATVGNQTSTYKTFEVNSDNVNIQNLRCSNSATISGLKVPSGVNYYWTDGNGNVVANTLDLTTTKTGNYQLVLAGGCITSQWFEIDDDRVEIIDGGLITADNSCGQKNGSIKGLIVFDPLLKISSQTWTNAGGNIAGNTPDIANLSAGTYILTIKTSDGCTSTYGPIVIKNISGPNVDQSHVNISGSFCGQTAGSVTALAVTGTGTLRYTWTNSSGQVVAQTKDLTDQPYGTYTLQVSDDSQCDPIILPFKIPEIHDLVISETKATKVTMATCGEVNGSITGLFVSGGDTYTWTNSTGKVVGNAVDLLNVGGGDYQLSMSNSCADTLKSQVYHITQQDKTTYPSYKADITGVCANNTNGSIIINTDALVKSVRWVNGQGATVSTSTTLTSVPPGSYQLYLTDQNGCETLYNSYTIAQITGLQLKPGIQVNDDQCTVGVGSVANIQVTGGETPYTYTWTDGAGNTVASTASIANLKAGDYTLTVKDASNCNILTSTYTIQDQQTIFLPPSVSNVQLCAPGDALLTVNNPSAGYTYRLYSDDNSPSPIDLEPSGRFKVNVQSNTSYYISQASGTCESARTQVVVTVGISGLNIANTITPNGDGVNDYWNINGIENYPAARVQVFTRYGQQVFDSKGYQHPFDGTYGGKPLPTGVYYYIIDMGNPNCNLLSGSLTILR